MLNNYHLVYILEIQPYYCLNIDLIYLSKLIELVNFNLINTG